jgi:hypothetical protein
MSRKLCTWTVLAIFGGGLIAGCGSSSSTTSSSQSTSSPAAAGSAPTSTPTSPSGATTPGAGVAVPNVGAAVAACKRTIHSQSTLTAGAKSKLEAVCGKAAKGDTAAVHKAAQEVCEEVIRTSAVPAGSAREHALAACKAG